MIVLIILDSLDCLFTSLLVQLFSPKNASCDPSILFCLSRIDLKSYFNFHNTDKSAI